MPIAAELKIHIRKEPMTMPVTELLVGEWQIPMIKYIATSIEKLSVMIQNSLLMSKSSFFLADGQLENHNKLRVKCQYFYLSK